MWILLLLLLLLYCDQLNIHFVYFKSLLAHLSQVFLAFANNSGSEMFPDNIDQFELTLNFGPVPLILELRVFLE